VSYVNIRDVFTQSFCYEEQRSRTHTHTLSLSLLLCPIRNLYSNVFMISWKCWPVEHPQNDVPVWFIRQAFSLPLFLRASSRVAGTRCTFREDVTSINAQQIRFMTATRTSLATRYSLTVSCNQFMLLPLHYKQHTTVRFEVFHGGDYEEWRLLGCFALWLL
jgi:hypothetical protein